LNKASEDHQDLKVAGNLLNDVIKDLNRGSSNLKGSDTLKKLSTLLSEEINNLNTFKDNLNEQ